VYITPVETLVVVPVWRIAWQYAGFDSAKLEEEGLTDAEC